MSPGITGAHLKAIYLRVTEKQRQPVTLDTLPNTPIALPTHTV